MKYMAKHAPEDSDDAEHEWYVEYEDHDSLVSLNGLREAEAKIIAFALNAVADDYELRASLDGHWDSRTCTKVWSYDGPTEGVAP